MKQKFSFFVLLFFTPVFVNLLNFNLFQVIKLDFKFLIICVLILSFLQIIALCYFMISIVKWISSGFKLQTFWPVLLSGIAIFCLHYSIKAFINSRIKRFENRFRNIPTLLAKRTSVRISNIS